MFKFLFRVKFLISGLAVTIFCACVHLATATEITVTCNILTTNYCYIEKEVEVKLDDTLKFDVENAESITALDFVQGSKLETVPAGIFKVFPALEKLFVSDTEIRSLQTDRFEGANNLKVLNIFNNEIEEIPSRVFSNLPETVEILLMSNKISTIEDYAFEGMTKLEVLRLSDNRIRKLTKLAFAGAPKIESIVLDSNAIDTIEDGAFNLPSLKTLRIVNNKLTTLSDAMFTGASLLQEVYFAVNQVTRIGKAFNECKKLRLLVLNQNPIEDVELTSLAGITDLDTIYLDGTKLTLSNDIESSATSDSKLKTISINDNHLSTTRLFKHLSIFGRLEKIFASSNQFAAMDDADKIKEYFPNIKQIGLDNNAPSLCGWISDNESNLKNVSAWSSQEDGELCRSADFQFYREGLRE